jgi:hypothetical protein
LHVFVSHVDWDGKKINQFNLFLKSQKVSRELESKYDLVSTEYKFNITEESLNSKNSRKYYLHNALRKSLKSYNTKSFIESKLSDDKIKLINGRYIENDQISILLGNKKAEILKYLEEQNMFNKIFKDELYKKVDSAFQKYKDSPEEFVKELKKNDVYVRKIYDNGIPHFVYGLKDVSFYIDDNKLARKFAYSSITGEQSTNEINVIGKSFTTEKQKGYLLNTVGKSLHGVRSLEAFAVNLKENNVELITYQNSGGIYGVAFKSLNIENAEIIKGSDIGISWNDIKDVIEDNREEIKMDINYDGGVEEYEEVEYTPNVPPKSVHNHKDQEDYESIRRKYRKKSKGMGR